jgi:hypothetical protein
MRRAANIDANQPAIVSALRAAGASVEPKLARVGDGVPDLLISFRGKWTVLEVKDGSKPPSRQALTPDEVRWHAQQQAQVHVVNSVEQALKVLDSM